MFDWLYDRIAKSVIGQIEIWMQEPKNIEQLTKLTDALVDREVKRLMGSLGGSQKGSVGEGQLDLGSLLSGRGGLSSKKLLGTALSMFLNRKSSDNQPSALP